MLTEKWRNDPTGGRLGGITQCNTRHSFPVLCNAKSNIFHLFLFCLFFKKNIALSCLHHAFKLIRCTIIIIIIIIRTEGKKRGEGEINGITANSWLHTHGGNSYVKV